MKKILIFSIIAILLATAGATAQTPDAYEPNNNVATATVLPLTFTGLSGTAETVGANIHVNGDLDYYKVELPATSNDTVLMFNARLHDSYNSADGNTYTLDCKFSYSINGGVSWSSAFDTQLSNIVALPAETTEIYLLVQSYNATGTGTYRLVASISKFSATPDAYEPNDDVASASLLPLQSISADTLKAKTAGATIHVSNNKDFYKIAIPAIAADSAYTVMARVHDLGSSADGNLYTADVYISVSTNGTSWSGDANTEIAPAGLATGVQNVWFRITPSNANTLGDYALEITLVKIKVDAYEPNNDQASAYQIPTVFVNDTLRFITENAFLHNSADRDYFKIVLPALANDSGYIYYVNLYDRETNATYGTNYTLDADYYYINGSSYTKGSIYTVYPHAALFTSGTLYFYIAPYSSSGFGTYAFEVIVVKTAPDVYEPNNSTSTAYSLPYTFNGLTATIKTNGATIHKYGDSDYYKVVMPVLPNDTNLVFTSVVYERNNTRDGGSYSGDTRQYYSFNGSSWTEFTDVDPVYISVPVGTAALYFRVEPDMRYTTTATAGTYSLAVGLQKVVFDPYETNDTYSTASLLPLVFVNDTAVVKTVNANLHISNDMDYYKIVIPPISADSLYSLNIRLHDMGDTHDGNKYTVDASFAYSTNGSTWVPSSGGTDTKLSSPLSVPNTGGTYYVRVGLYEGSTGTYALEMTLTKRKYPADKYEPNNDVATATKIPYTSRGYMISDANIGSTTDVDYYYFAVPKATELYKTAVGATLYHLYNKESSSDTWTLYGRFAYSTDKGVTWSNYSTGTFANAELPADCDTVYFKVMAYTTYSNVGTYKIEVNTAQIYRADQFEPNDDLAHAAVLPLVYENAAVANAATGVVTFHTTTDKDFYRIDIPAVSGDTLNTFTLDFGNYYEGGWGELYTADATIAYSLDGGATFTMPGYYNYIPYGSYSNDIIYPVTIPSTCPSVYIRIQHYSSSAPSAGTYYFDFHLQKLFPDQYETNNTLATAAAIPLVFDGVKGKAKTDGATMHVDTDTDYYKVELPAAAADSFYVFTAALHNQIKSSDGQKYTLRARFAWSIDNGETWSADNDTLIDNTIKIPNGINAVYFQVKNYYADNKIGSYALDVDVKRTNHYGDMYEVNDSLPVATPVPLRFVNGTASFSTQGANIHETTDVDIYRIDFPATDSLYLVTLRTFSEVYPSDYISYDGGVSWSYGYGSYGSAFLLPDTVSTLYYKVSSNWSTGIYSFQINVRKIPDTRDPYEPNNSTSNPTVLPLVFENGHAQVKTQGATFHPTDYYDVYKIVLPATAANISHSFTAQVLDKYNAVDGNTYTFDAKFDFSSPELNAWLNAMYWSNGRYNVDSSNAFVLPPADSTYTLFFTVKPYSEGSTGAYEFEFIVDEVEALLPDPYEPNNDSWASDKAFTLPFTLVDGHATIKTVGANFHATGDADWYKVILPELPGYLYTVNARLHDSNKSADGNEYTANPYLYYVSSDNFNTKYGYETNMTNTYIAPDEGGIVYFNADAYARPELGTYALEININTIPSNGDSYEDNDTRARAYEFPVNFVNKKATIHTTGANFHHNFDSDWYKIALPPLSSDSIYSIRITEPTKDSNGVSYTAPYKLSEMSSKNQSWETTYDASFAVTEKTDTIFIHVAPYNRGGAGTYEIQIDITKKSIAENGDEYEYNNTLETAYLFTNTYREIQPTLHYFYDEDYYKVALPAGNGLQMKKMAIEIGEYQYSSNGYSAYTADVNAAYSIDGKNWFSMWSGDNLNFSADVDTVYFRFNSYQGSAHATGSYKFVYNTTLQSLPQQSLTMSTAAPIGNNFQFQYGMNEFDSSIYASFGGMISGRTTSALASGWLSGRLLGDTVKIYSTGLRNLNIANNAVTSLKIEAVTPLAVLQCQNNALRFSTLPLPAGFEQYVYAPQATMNGDTLLYTETVDLSAEALVNGAATVYEWCEVNNDAETPFAVYPLGNGKFAFDAAAIDKTLRCKMTNATFPDLTLAYEVFVRDQTDTGVHSLEQGMKIYVSGDKLHIRFFHFQHSESMDDIRIYDVSGRTVGVESFRPVQNGEQIINISHLPSGVYIVKAGNTAEKIVKN